jgi:hypothetical protein
MGRQKRISLLGLMALVVWLMPVSSMCAGPQGTANEKNPVCGQLGHLMSGN